MIKSSMNTRQSKNVSHHLQFLSTSPPLTRKSRLNKHTTRPYAMYTQSRIHIFIILLHHFLSSSLLIPNLPLRHSPQPQLSSFHLLHLASLLSFQRLHHNWHRYRPRSSHRLIDGVVLKLQVLWQVCWFLR